MNSSSHYSSLGIVKSSALLILTVFCAMLFLQTGCTAGVLSHCDHQASHHQNLDQCGHDRCGDDYPVPGKVTVKSFVSHSQAVLALSGNVGPASSHGTPALYSQPIVAKMPRPAGTFPLLI